MAQGKGAFDVFPTFCTAEGGLRFCPPAAEQREAVQGDSVLPCPSPDQKVSLIETPFPEALHVKRHRNKEVNAANIPELKKRLPGNGAQWPGQGTLLSVLKQMNGLHKAAVIYPEGPCLSEIPFLKEALRTSVALSFPRNKGEATP
jgi:hypothetical protein